MNDNEDRDRLRSLQDRWLAQPKIWRHIREFGEDGPVADGASTTLRDVRTSLLPEWEAWFREALR